MNPRDLINKLKQEDAAGLDTSDALSALYQTDEPAQITSINSLDQSIMRKAQEQIKPTPWWLKAGGFATAATVLLAVVISLDVQQKASSPAPVEHVQSLELEQDSAALAARKPKQTNFTVDDSLQDQPGAKDKFNSPTTVPAKTNDEASSFATITNIDTTSPLQRQEKAADFNDAADPSGLAAVPTTPPNKPSPPPRIAKPALESASINNGQLEEVMVTPSKRVAPRPMALQSQKSSYTRQRSVINNQQQQLAKLKALLDQYIQQKTNTNKATAQLVDLLLLYQQRHGEATLHADLPLLNQQKTLLLLLSKAQTSRLPAPNDTQETTED